MGAGTGDPPRLRGGLLCVAVVGPAALFLYLAALDLLFALLVFRVRTTRTWMFALLAASTFVAIELVDSWLTLWGTATTVSRDLGSPLEKGLVPATMGESPTSAIRLGPASVDGDLPGGDRS